MTPEVLQDRCITIAELTDPLDREYQTNLLCTEVRGLYSKPIVKAAIQEVAQRHQAERMAEQGQDIVAEINNKYFIMNAESKVRVGSLDQREVNGHRIQHLNLMTGADFGMLMANRLIEGQPADQMWIAHPDRRQYKGFFTHPDKPETHDEKLNLWHGFSVKPKKGSVKAFLSHIHDLVGGDPAQAEYVINWIAWGFQNPAKPIGTCIVFIGEQGTGKGMLGNTLHSIWGNHGTRIGNEEDLVGKHNNHLLSCCFAFCDEALFAGNKKVADILKGIITEPTLSIEPKFQDRFTVDNMLNLMCASNHSHAMQIEPKDRRYAVFGVPDTMLDKTPEHYAKHAKIWSENQVGKAAILYFMLNRDLSKFNAQRDRPSTSFYLDQKLASLAADWLWWRQVSERESFHIGKGLHSSSSDLNAESCASGDTIVNKAALYSSYCDWHNSTQRGHPVDVRVFYRNANKWLFEDQDHIRQGPRHDQIRRVTVRDFEVIYQRLEVYLSGQKL